MKESLTDIDYFKSIYSKARNKYKPPNINTLIVAEAPPCALDRFFYFEDVKRQDSLFLEIMGILYPDQKEKYLSAGRETGLKEDLLYQFQSDGYWLLDLYEVPNIVANISSSDAVKSLIIRVGNLIDATVPIILIKANVYDECYSALKSNGYNVINKRIPFPGSGQQKVFRIKFKNALQVYS